MGRDIGQPPSSSLCGSNPRFQQLDLRGRGSSCSGQPQILHDPECTREDSVLRKVPGQES